jgi:hypothetical protein
MGADINPNVIAAFLTHREETVFFSGIVSRLDAGGHNQENLWRIA